MQIFWWWTTRLIETSSQLHPRIKINFSGCALCKSVLILYAIARPPTDLLREKCRILMTIDGKLGTSCHIKTSHGLQLLPLLSWFNSLAASNLSGWLTVVTMLLVESFECLKLTQFKFLLIIGVFLGGLKTWGELSRFLIRQFSFYLLLIDFLAIICYHRRSLRLFLLLNPRRCILLSG